MEKRYGWKKNIILDEIKQRFPFGGYTSNKRMIGNLSLEAKSPEPNARPWISVDNWLVTWRRMMGKYGMTDSGKRQPFGKNMAIRDTADDKPRPDLISPFAEERLGHWLRMGAAKYAERNWEKGMPFSRCVASLKRHVMRFQQGMRDEDHLAAIMFNAMAISTTRR